MKRLFFSRHAKSSWGDLSLRDIDRPLNKRGKRDAPIMAEKLSQIIDHIDLLLSSPAKRTLLTRSYFEKNLSHSAVGVDKKIYGASHSDLLNVICDLSDEYESVLLFGHNPSFTMIYNHLADNYLDNLPTSGIFGISSQATIWNDLDATNSKIEFLIYPKLYIS